MSQKRMSCVACESCHVRIAVACGISAGSPVTSGSYARATSMSARASSTQTPRSECWYERSHACARICSVFASRSVRGRAVHELVGHVQQAVGPGQRVARQVLVVEPVAEAAHAVRARKVRYALVAREARRRQRARRAVCREQLRVDRGAEVVLQVQAREHVNICISTYLCIYIYIHIYI